MGQPGEVVGRSRRLETDEVGAKQAIDELTTPRDVLVQLDRGEGDVQEETDLEVRAGLTQHPGNQLQLVVLHPHRGILRRPLGDLFGESGVDSAVGVPPLTVELGIDDTVVVERPQARVGEALVVLGDFLSAQRYRNDVVPLVVEGFDGFVRGTVPTDPSPTLALHDGFKCRDEATR